MYHRLHFKNKMFFKSLKKITKSIEEHDPMQNENHYAGLNKTVADKIIPPTKQKQLQKGRNPMKDTNLVEEPKPPKKKMKVKNNIQILKEKYANVKWRKGSLQIPENVIEFRNDSRLPAAFLEILTPSDFVIHFFTNKLYTHITEQSNLLSAQI